MFEVKDLSAVHPITQFHTITLVGHHGEFTTNFNHLTFTYIHESLQFGQPNKPKLELV